MTTETKDGNLIITIPMGTPTPSASGKSLVIASTRGNKPSTVQIDGKPLIVSVNAYVQK